MDAALQTRRRRFAPCAGTPRLLVLLACALQAGAQTYGNLSGKPVCQNGSWLGRHEPLSDPKVQCFRSPPCIRWNWLTHERCKSMKSDADYPTWDPHLPPSSPAQVALADAFRTLLANKTIFFVGDSINGLVYHAALCELARGDLDVHKAQPSDPSSSKAYALPGVHARAQAFLARLAALGAEDKRLKKAAEARGEALNEKYSSSGVWLGGAPGKPEVIPQTGTFVVPKGWHKWQESDMAGILSLADVVVLNYGLHYHGPEGHHDQRWPHYEAEMEKLFAQLEAFAAQPGKAAVFRETGAEHPVARDPALPHPTNCLCAPLSPAAAAASPAAEYNRIIARVAQGAPHVKVLPFYDLTLPRHDLHEGPYCAFGEARRHPEKQDPHSCCDCCHLCHTPQLWRTVFDRLHQALLGSQLAASV